MKRWGEEVTLAIRDEITRLRADQYIHTTRTRCNGRCADACVVIAYPEGVWYREVTPDIGRQLVREHAAGRRLEEQAVYQFNGTFVGSGTFIPGIDKE